MRRHGPFLVLLLGCFLVGTLYAALTPAWQAPDEPAHYNYVQQLVAGTLPVIEPGDYDQVYQAEAITARFSPPYTVTGFTYEDHQPPLYYLLQVPIFLITGGDLLAMRLLSVLLGAGVVALAYASARMLFPDRPWLSLTITAFVAFLPQHVAILASVNNDSLAELLIAAVLWFVVRDRAWWDRELAWQPGGGRLYGLGLLLGLTFLTKATAYIMAPVVGLLLLWRLWGNWATLWRTGLRLFLPALLLGGIWWGRNIIVYETLDPLASAAHNEIVVGQPRTETWIDQYGLSSTIEALARTTFQSFWGQFGWMGVVMPSWTYRLLLFLSFLAGAGWLLRRRLAPDLSLPPAIGRALLLTVLLNLSLYLGYNLTFVQHQGRYLFPSLIPLAIAFGIGLSAWAMPLLPRLPALAWTLPALLALGLIGLDLLALFRFILPALVLP
jgi:4-amino-4-deoxy-L-arabinose transferase-like glycosyltransferase